MSGPGPQDRPVLVGYGDTVDRVTLMCPCGLRANYATRGEAADALETHERQHAERAETGDDGPLEAP